MKRRTQLIGAVVLALTVCLALWAVRRRSLVGLFVTPDQQADWRFRHGRFKEAAPGYTDPMRQGVAWYRAAEFEKAARAFARASGPEGAFDEGTSWLMHGAYDQALAAYDRALSQRPGWPLAEENRAIAMARRDRVRRQGGDSTGGKVEADGTVFDLNKQAGQETTTAGGAPLSEADLNALWLRRVQTTPADFLRAKFAYQAAQRGRAK